jgi:hypothetical protein
MSLGKGEDVLFSVVVELDAENELGRAETKPSVSPFELVMQMMSSSIDPNY